MDATFRNERSLHGFRIDVLKSALQKYIRRSNYEKAIFCAQELDLFAEISGGERIRTNFIHRLMIIFLEDIGLGGISLWSEIDDRIDILLKERKRNNRSRAKEIQTIHELIFIFTALPKLRIASFAKNYWNCNDQDTEYKLTSSNINPEIHDKIRSMKLLEEAEGVKELWKRLENHKHFRLIQKWYRELKTLGENFLCWTVPLCADIFGFDNVGIPSDLPSRENWDYLRSLEPPKFDSFVFDKHTRTHPGNKTLAFFAEQGSHVEPESKLVENKNIAWMKWLYLKKRDLSLPTPHNISDFPPKQEISPEPKKKRKIPAPRKVIRLLDDGDEKLSEWDLIQSESDIGKFVMRIQLTTSKGKCDVYLVERDNNPYIVKGPYLESRTVDRFLELQKFKAEHGLPSITARKVLCVPDRWKEGVPLGIRNSTDRSQKYSFLVSDSLIPAHKFVSRIHESKIWPKTEVMDPEKTFLHAEIDKLDEQGMIDYYSCIGFRLHFRLSDMAKRNFLHVDGRVYSIDEESVKDNINLQDELRGDRWKILSEKWSQYEKMIPEIFASQLRPWFGKNN